MRNLTFGTIAVITGVSLVAIPLMWVYHTVFITGDMSRIAEGLSVFIIICAVLLLVADFIVAERLKPVDRLLSGVRNGAPVTEAEQDRARRQMKSIPVLIVLVNLIGFFLGPVLSATIRAIVSGSPVLSVTTFLAILHAVSIGNLAAGLELNLTTLLFIEPMAAMKTYRFPDGIRAGDTARSSTVRGLIPVLSSAMLLFVAGIAKDLRLYRGSFVLPAVVLLAVLLPVSAIFLYIDGVIVRKKLAFLNDRLRGITGERADLRQRISIIRFDQYGVVAASVNQLMENLESTLQAVTSAGRRLLDSSGRLSSAVGESRSGAETLRSSTREIETHSELQKSAADRTLLGMDGLLAQIGTIDEEVIRQSKSVEESSAALEEMAGNIESVAKITDGSRGESAELLEAAGEGVREVGKTVESIRDIAKTTKEISSMIGAVSKIAAQTNLLAMNAAIEAAHAGDTGRGFAVVADEVRKLAETSAQTTKAVTGNMKEMLQRITAGEVQAARVSGIFGTISERIDRITGYIATINDAMTEQKTGAEQILRSMTALVEATTGIRNLVKDQHEGSESMKRELAGLAGSAETVRTAVAKQASSVEAMSLLTDGLGTVVRENLKAAEELRDVAQVFGQSGSGS